MSFDPGQDLKIEERKRKHIVETDYLVICQSITYTMS